VATICRQRGARWWGLVGAATLAAGALPAGPVTAAARTRVIPIRPVTAQGHLQPGYRITQRFTQGTCEAGSDVLSGVYRCFAGNFVFDPCWADDASSAPGVYCQSEPWSRDVAHLSLKQPLVASPGGPLAIWGLQLSGGQRCIAAQGAHSFFDGGRYTVNFFCPGSLVLLNQAKQTGAVWTIGTARTKGGGFVLGRPANIAIAWQGLPSHL